MRVTDMEGKRGGMGGSGSGMGRRGRETDMEENEETLGGNDDLEDEDEHEDEAGDNARRDAYYALYNSQ